jgi:prephenate dehydrogenase
MKIGIIGIGQMGGTLARGWRENGHSVCVADKPAYAEVHADVIALNRSLNPL